MNGSERYCSTCGACNQPGDERCFACGNPLTTPSDTEETIHAHILRQRYRLHAQIGSGGFSAVYKALDTASGQLVAIKAISLRGLSAKEKIEATDAFNREVTLLTRLQHRHLPHVHDHFSDTECWYLVMDFISGTTLEKRLLDRGSTQLPLEEVLDIGLVLCDVLDYLHQQQPAIIFRDLKPANIMLTADGHLCLIDFGIARHFKPGQLRDTTPFGSPGYAAPEQYGKAQTTPRSDIYSLGAILHQLLSGQDPSQTPFSFAALDQRQEATFKQLNTLIQQMVQVDAQQRPGTMRVVKEELQRITTNYTRRRGLHTPQHSRTSYQPPVTPWPTYSMPVQPSLQTAYTTRDYATTVASTMSQVQTMTAPVQLGGTPSFTTIPYVRNNYAIASLLCSLLGIFLPPLLCFVSSYIYTPIRDFHSVLPILMVLLPSLLGIIFGHIGRYRARATPGMQGSADTALTGLIVGYIFVSLYLALMICLFSALI